MKKINVSVDGHYISTQNRAMKPLEIALCVARKGSREKMVGVIKPM
jgi:hypothetical protein